MAERHFVYNLSPDTFRAMHDGIFTPYGYLLAPNNATKRLRSIIRLAPRASFAAEVLVVAALAAALEKASAFTRADYLARHPAGLLGQGGDLRFQLSLDGVIDLIRVSDGVNQEVLIAANNDSGILSLAGAGSIGAFLSMGASYDQSNLSGTTEAIARGTIYAKKSITVDAENRLGVLFVSSPLSTTR